MLWIRLKLDGIPVKQSSVKFQKLTILRNEHAYLRNDQPCTINSNVFSIKVLCDER
jgi:hypothetical protein